MNEIALRYFECIKYDKTRNKYVKFIKTFESGEKMTVKIIGIKKYLILLFIDYFILKTWESYSKNKRLTKDLKLVLRTYKEFKFKHLIVDNDKQFNNYI